MHTILPKRQKSIFVGGLGIRFKRSVVKMWVIYEKEIEDIDQRGFKFKWVK